LPKYGKNLSLFLLSTKRQLKSKYNFVSSKSFNCILL
jgi:hypothetical protein